MDVQSIMSTDFLYLQADWTVKKAVDLMQALEPPTIIVHRRDPDGKEYDYLFSIEMAMDRILSKHLPDIAPLLEALNLHELSASARVDAAASAGSAPSSFVAVIDGKPVGYYNASDMFSTQNSFEASWSEEKVTRGDLHNEAGDSTNVVERLLTAEFPEKVALNSTVSLLVYITSKMTPGQGIGLSLPVGTLLKIIVQARKGLVLEGNNEGELSITTEEETLPLQFSMRATSTGPADLRVLVFQQGAPVGMIRLAPVIVEQISTGDVRPIDTRTQALAPATIKLPDLALLIEETQVNGVRGFILRLNALDPHLNLNYARFGPILLRSDPGQYFEALYKDIEDYKISSPTEVAITAQKLADKGSFLFTILFPKEVQQKLWELKDRITSVIIQSEEPWIPWELCKLTGEENGMIAEGPFFNEQFAITRWIPGIGLQSTLTLKNVAVVMPEDSGLPYAGTELSFLQSLAGSERAVSRVPARFQDLHKAFQTGKFDTWHFTGHGGYRDPDPNRSVMYLENRDEFRPENIAGAAANLGRARPLVFLNACQIGRAGMSLTDIGGWARQFLSVGAAAFIGAYWSVYDQPACNFSKEVYNRLIGGEPIGEAVKQARKAIRTSGDPTWLAYTVYADPMARIG